MESEEQHSEEQIYRVVKCPLKSVLKNYITIQPVIEKTVLIMNDISILTYQFIRLYLLNKFNNNQKLPTINTQLILDIMRTVSYTDEKRGKRIKEKYIENKTEIRTFYKDIFIDLVPEYKPCYTHKNHILTQTANEILTGIKTNMSNHFVKQLFKYINCLFKDQEI